MKQHPTSRATWLSRIKQLGCLITILSLVFLLTGCPAEQKKAAQDLSKQGVDKMDQLASFYDTLAQDRVSHEELFVLLRLVPTNTVETDRTKKAYKDQVDALQARAAHARAVKNLYVSLGKLVDYDASSEVQGAVKDLLDAAKKVKTFKLTIPGLSLDEATVTSALNKGIELLTTYLQVRAFRKNAPEAAAYLGYIRTFYDAESFVYLQIIRDYDDLARRLDKNLIQSDQLSASSRFKKYADRYNLDLNSTAPSTQSVKNWAMDRIDADFDAGQKTAENLVARQVKNLVDLQQSHKDFMSGKIKKTTESS
jgi:hypothetical protein